MWARIFCCIFGRWKMGARVCGLFYVKPANGAGSLGERKYGRMAPRSKIDRRGYCCFDSWRLGTPPVAGSGAELDGKHVKARAAVGVTGHGAVFSPASGGHQAFAAAFVRGSRAPGQATVPEREACRAGAAQRDRAAATARPRPIRSGSGKAVRCHALAGTRTGHSRRIAQHQDLTNTRAGQPLKSRIYHRGADALAVFHRRDGERPQQRRCARMAVHPAGREGRMPDQGDPFDGYQMLAGGARQ